MAIFKKAKEAFIPDSMLDTKSWLSDKGLAKAMGISEHIKSLNEKEMLNAPFDKHLRAKMCWGITFSKLTEDQIRSKLNLTTDQWNAMLYGSKDVSESYYEKAISLMEENHVQTK